MFRQRRIPLPRFLRLRDPHVLFLRFGYSFFHFDKEEPVRY